MATLDKKWVKPELSFPPPFYQVLSYVAKIKQMLSTDT
jgi:hypothetical protein